MIQKPTKTRRVLQRIDYNADLGVVANDPPDEQCSTIIIEAEKTPLDVVQEHNYAKPSSEYAQFDISFKGAKVLSRLYFTVIKCKDNYNDFACHLKHL